MNGYPRLLPLLALVITVAGCRSPGDASGPAHAPDAPAAPAPVASAAAPEPARPGAAPAPEPGWWNGRVFYEIFVRSFADSTTGPLANDGIGDLQGLIEKLDYLNDGNPATTSDLGITGIWLMPISPSPSYHGYDVTDYYGINPQYGTLEDFRRFLAEAHRRGIRVITDLVLNHSSAQHPGFKAALRGDPAYRDWYIFVPPDQVPQSRGPWGQQVWQEMNGQHYYGIFWSGMPDLNYRTPAVTAEAYRIADFWLTDVGVDGFRLDAIRHLIEDGDVMNDTPETVAWLKGFQAHVKRTSPGALTVGEVWTGTETVSEYVHADAVDLAFEFDLAGAILDAAKSGRRDKLAYTLENVSAAYPPGRYATMITNHDQNRVASELREDPRRLRLAATLLLTAPGVPFLYYGEEIGQIGAKPDEMIRNPMPWTGGANGGFTAAAQPWEPLQPGHAQRNVAAQDADPASLLAHYRRLVRLRQSEPALAIGDVRVLDTGRDDVLAFERSADGRRLTVIANLSNSEIRDYRLPGASAGFGAELIGGTGANASGVVTLAPLAAYVFAQAGP
jgi:glycosidase